MNTILQTQELSSGKFIDCPELAQLDMAKGRPGPGQLAFVPHCTVSLSIPSEKCTEFQIPQGTSFLTETYDTESI